MTRLWPRRLLHTACGRLAGIFGEAPCILGLHAAMHGARSLDGEHAEAFAEAAAHGMVRFRVRQLELGVPGYLRSAAYELAQSH